MSDMNAVFPSSFELWEFVTSFEDGSLPTKALSDDAIAAVAVWYLYLLPPDQAMQRLEHGLRRNQFRLAQRSVAQGDVFASPEELWLRVLRRVLSCFGAGDAVAVANRLLERPAAAVREAA